MADTGTMLLTAILADPADDAPRLAYADWLDERGGPGDAERAEFIRVQVEAVRLHPDSARRVALEWRAAELLTEHGFTWWSDVCRATGMPVSTGPAVDRDALGAPPDESVDPVDRIRNRQHRTFWPVPCPGEPDDFDWPGYRLRGCDVAYLSASGVEAWRYPEPGAFAGCRLRRGFPESLELDADERPERPDGPDAVGVLPRWLSAYPVAGVALNYVGPDSASRMFGLALDRVSRLELVQCEMGVLDALADSAALESLSELRVGFYFDEYADPPPARDWYARELGRLLRSPLAGRLRSLGVRINTLAAAEALAAASLPLLERLDVDLSAIGPDGGPAAEAGRRLALVAAGVGMPQLRRLGVAGLRTAAQLAFAGPAFGRIEALEVRLPYEPPAADETGSPPTPLDWLGRLPAGLRELRLIRGGPVAGGLARLAESPAVRRLRRLFLEVSGEGDAEALEALSDLENLETFAVSWWHLDEQLKASLGRRGRFVFRHTRPTWGLSTDPDA